jgi:hypothetical protein
METKQPSSDVLAFLIESYKRLSAKSPKLFQVWQKVGMIAALITGIPLFIQQVEMFTGLEVPLPDIVNSTLVRVVFWCGLVVKFMGKLPVTTPPEFKPEQHPFTTKNNKV